MTRMTMKIGAHLDEMLLGLALQHSFQTVTVWMNAIHAEACLTMYNFTLFCSSNYDMIVMDAMGP